MGLIRQLFHHLTLGIVSSDEQLAAEEEARKIEYHRQHTPCSFSDDLTEIEFEALAHTIAKPYKRLSVTVDGQFVTGSVRTVSGINAWSFKLDYNDFGSVTGSYWWVFCQNNESTIPDNFAKELSAAIQAYHLKRRKD